MVGTIKQDAEGMAQCITDLTKNVSEGKDMMDGTDSYNKSEKVDTKIYIPYGKYTGEGKQYEAIKILNKRKAASKNMLAAAFLELWNFAEMQ